MMRLLEVDVDQRVRRRAQIIEHNDRGRVFGRSPGGVERVSGVTEREHNAKGSIIHSLRDKPLARSLLGLGDQRLRNTAIATAVCATRAHLHAIEPVALALILLPICACGSRHSRLSLGLAGGEHESGGESAHALSAPCCGSAVKCALSMRSRGPCGTFCRRGCMSLRRGLPSSSACSNRPVGCRPSWPPSPGASRGRPRVSLRVRPPSAPSWVRGASQARVTSACHGPEPVSARPLGIRVRSVHVEPLRSASPVCPPLPARRARRSRVLPCAAARAQRGRVRPALVEHSRPSTSTLAPSSAARSQRRVEAEVLRLASALAAALIVLASPRRGCVRISPCKAGAVARTVLKDPAVGAWMASRKTLAPTSSLQDGRVSNR